MKIKVAAIQIQAHDVTGAGDALRQSLQFIDLAAKNKPNLIVLPECTYPGYFLGHTGNTEAVLQGLDKAVTAYRQKAREHGVFLAVGAAERREGKIYNSAYLINPLGEVLGNARKSFLWHFDSKWFSSFDEYPVYDTPIGKLGIIVCADGRQPEISRVLALKGAQLIIDVTNWVTTGSDKRQLSNPQYEYMLPSRALENKVWCVAANKVGIEAQSIVYTGRSCIISPQGEHVVVANSHEEEIITAEIDLELSADKKIDDSFDVIKGRNPKAYDIIVQPTETLPVTRVLQEKVCPSDMAILSSVVQLDSHITFDEYQCKVESIVPMMALQSSQLVVFAELPCLYNPAVSQAVIKQAARLSKQLNILVVTSTVIEREGNSYKVAILAEEGNVHVYEKTHLDAEEQKLYTTGSELPVFATRLGRIGLMMGYDGVIPETARCLMLNGADVICWQNQLPAAQMRMLTRTRAAENRLSIVSAGIIVNANGVIVASTFPQGDQIVSSMIELAQSRVKKVVPGTDVVLHRIPASYGRLLEG